MAPPASASPEWRRQYKHSRSSVSEALAAGPISLFRAGQTKGVASVEKEHEVKTEWPTEEGIKTKRRYADIAVSIISPMGCLNLEPHIHSDIHVNSCSFCRSRLVLFL